MDETVVSVITRAVRKTSLWNPLKEKGNILVFSSKGRIFLIPAYDVNKGIFLNTLSPIIGSFHDGSFFGVKKLEEQDEMVANISISQCEEKSQRIITKNEIVEFKIENCWGIKTLLLILNSGERLQFGTLDQQGLEKTIKEFPKYLENCGR